VLAVGIRLLRGTGEESQVDNIWTVRVVRPLFIFVGGLPVVVFFTAILVDEIRHPTWAYVWGRVLGIALAGLLLVWLWLMSGWTIRLNDQCLVANVPLPRRGVRWSVAVVDIREIRFTDPAGGGPILILGNGERILAKLPGYLWSKAQMAEIGGRLGVPVTGYRRYKARDPIQGGYTPES
jgi:hypothetical protein